VPYFQVCQMPNVQAAAWDSTGGVFRGPRRKWCCCSSGRASLRSDQTHRRGPSIARKAWSARCSALSGHRAFRVLTALTGYCASFSCLRFVAPGSCWRCLKMNGHGTTLKGFQAIAASAACGIAASGSWRHCLKSLPSGFVNFLHAS